MAQWGNFEVPAFSDGTRGTRYSYGRAVAPGRESDYDPYEREQAEFRRGQNQLVLQEIARQNETAEMRRRNAMGLSPLSEQLLDPYSAAYQYTDAQGNKPEPYIDISVGGLDGSAPAPLPKRPVQLGLRRTLKPEYQDAFDALGASGSRTRSVDEMRQIEQAKADERIRLAQEQAALKGELQQRGYDERGLAMAANIQAKDPAADYNTIASDYATSRTGLGISPIRPRGFTQQQPIQAPAMQGAPAFSDDPRNSAIFKRAKAKYPNYTDDQILEALTAKGLL